MVVTDISKIYRGPGTGLGAPISPIREHVEKRTYVQPKVTRGRDPRARIEIKRRVVTSIKQLPKSKQVLFVKREATRVHQEIKKQTRKIPTLQDIGMAGYKYGKAHPKSAKLIYDSLDAKARIIRKIVPKEAGIPAAKAMFAFSDGAIKGIRNEPVKTLAFFALPGVAGVAIKGARYIPIASKMVKSEKAMKAASHIFNVAYAHNVYTRTNAPILDHYKDGKVISETSKKLPDGSIQITQQIEQIPVMRKPTLSEKSERLGYIFSTEAAPMVGGAKVASSISKAKYAKLSKTARTTTKTTVKKFKKGTKEFIKHEKAEAQLIKKKKKRPVQKLVQIQKPEPKVLRVSEITGLAKPEIIPKFVLIKDPKAIALAKSNKELLKEAKAVVGIKTRPLKQRELMEFEKSTPEALKHVDQSIEEQLKQLNNVKNIVTKPTSKSKIANVVKEYEKIKIINSKLQLSNKQLLKFYTQLKTLLKATPTSAVKTKIKNILKQISSQQTKIKSLLKQRTKILSKTKSSTKKLQKTKDISRAIVLLKKAKKVPPKIKKKIKVIPPPRPKPKPKPIPKPIIKPKPKPTPPPKKREKIYKPEPKPKPRPKPRPKPKVKPVPIPIIIIPVIPLKRKVKPKKKKKMTESQYRDWFVKNEIPTLKSLYG